MNSVSRPSAVDDQSLTGDVAAGVTGEKEKGSVEIRWLAVAGEQGVPKDPFLDLLDVDDGRRCLRLYESRHEAIDPDAVTAPLRCPLPRDGLQPTFRCGVDRLW